MKIWCVNTVSYDGGRIGKTWKQELYSYESAAKTRMIEIVNIKNEYELHRTESFIKRELESYQTNISEWSRLYRHGIIENIECWINTAYQTAIYISNLELNACDNQSDVVSELKKALAESMFCRHFTTSKCIDYDSAGSTYQVDWTKQFKEWAKLADVDLSKHNPTAYDI